MAEREQTGLHFSDFALEIPQELWRDDARRNASETRMVVVDARAGTIHHDRFVNLGDYLDDSDVLVTNDTGISCSRLLGRCASGFPVDICFVLDQGEGRWEAMIMSDGGPPPEEGSFELAGGISGEILGRVSVVDPHRISEFDAHYWIEKDRYQGYRGLIRISATHGELRRALEGEGKFMYPWYTNLDRLEKGDLYPITTQRLGAVLISEPARRLTPEMLTGMKSRGIDQISVSLWMSFGWNYWAFKKADMALSENRMNFEEYEVTAPVVEQIREAMRDNRRLIAIGTSCARVLESLPIPPIAQHSRTDLFLYPGVSLKYCSALVTNLHNSMATHIVMAATFGGKDLVLGACKEAIKRGYGFGIHGDSMLVLSDTKPTATSLDLSPADVRS